MNRLRDLWIGHSYFYKRKMNTWVWYIVRAVLIAGLCFLIIQPFLKQLSLSFMMEKDLYDSTVANVPKHFTLDNYKLTATILDYRKSFINSLFFSLAVSLIQVISCTFVGYGFARFEFPGKRILFGLVILTLVVPPQTIVSALYMNFRYFDVAGIFQLTTGSKVNLIGTYWPSILLGAGCVGLKNGLYIYMIRQFFRGMPKELEEAAYVDGSSSLRTFITIILPCAIPIIVSCFLFSFVWQWNDLFYSSLFTQGKSLLPKMMGGIYGALSDDKGNVSTGRYVEMITSTADLMVKGPLIIVYIFAQRNFIESMERSGLKG